MTLVEKVPAQDSALPKDQCSFTGLISELVPFPRGAAMYRIKPKHEFNGLKPYDRVGACILRVASSRTLLQYNLELFSAFETNPLYKANADQEGNPGFEPIHFLTLGLIINEELQKPGTYQLIAARKQVDREYHNPDYVSNLVTDVRMQRHWMEPISSRPASIQ